MATNRDTGAARAFHDATKYIGSEIEGQPRILMGVAPNLGPAIGEQAPALEPLPYKIYTTLDPIPLPREFAPHAMPVLTAIAQTGEEPAGERVPDLAAVARLCLLSNGLLKRGALGQREIEFRAAGGTGARYHLELYAVCGDLPDLPAGVYHYAAHDHTLRRLRAGDFRAALVEATGAEPAVAHAPVTIVGTSTFWRNAWRYQARAYRHTYWDAGTTFANLLAAAASAELPTRTVLGFADRDVNRLLDVDGEREAAVVMVALGRSVRPPSSAPAVTPLDLPTRPLSPREIDFPAIPAMHAAASLVAGTDAAVWRAEPLRRTLPPPGGALTRLEPLAPADWPAVTVDDAIRRRRSVRHYAAEAPVPFAAFSTLLAASARGFAADCLDPSAPPLHDRYLIVNAVEGLTPGSYVQRWDRRAVELLNAGEWRAEAQRLAVRQAYAGEAHVNVYALTDLAPVISRFGDRGYRVAQFEAAVFAGRLHLGVHALGLGAVGSTSFDDEVTAFFSPHAAGKSFMFVVVFGLRRRREG